MPARPAVLYKTSRLNYSISFGQQEGKRQQSKAQGFNEDVNSLDCADYGNWQQSKHEEMKSDSENDTDEPHSKLLSLQL